MMFPGHAAAAARRAGGCLLVWLTMVVVLVSSVPTPQFSLSHHPRQENRTLLPQEDDDLCLLPREDGAPCSIPQGNGVPFSLPQGNGVPFSLPQGNGVPFSLPQGNGTPFSLPRENGAPFSLPRENGVPFSLPREDDALSLLRKEANDSSAAEKDGKFIFTVVQFPNLQCGTGLDTGTCLTAQECDQRGGKNVGTCARGYGICCQVSLEGCGGNIFVNNTLVLSTNYPGYYSQQQTCTYNVYFNDTICPICQIRYDYIDMELVAPSLQGTCDNDKLVFLEDQKSEYFCGKAPDNYHWYVETAGTSSPHTFTITTDGTVSQRRYAIQVSFVPCNQNVPTYCGQYYTGTSGTITSYNYNNGVYLAGLKYSICFRKEENYCTYTLKKKTDNQFVGIPDTFRLMVGSGIQPLPNPSIFGSPLICSDPASARSTLYFTLDYCLYPESITSSNTRAPFFVTIRTLVDAMDNRNPLATGYSGFDFDWEANLCT